VGTWNDEAEVKPTPFGPGGKMNISETCDWFTGGFSVVCNAKATGLQDGLKTLVVLTYDGEEKVYRLYEFNSVGRSNAAKGTVDGDTWMFNGESKVNGKLIRTRSTLRVTSPDSATMKSEMSVEGGPWTLVMELKGTRAKQSQTDFNSCVPHGSEGWPFELFECYRILLRPTEPIEKQKLSKRGPLVHESLKNQLNELMDHWCQRRWVIHGTEGSRCETTLAKARDCGQQVGVNA
jgi:hypothetical protein